jgi:hypothetical protein
VCIRQGLTVAPRRRPSTLALLGAVALGLAVQACGGDPAPVSPVAQPALVRLVARGIELQPARLELPAGVPIQIDLDNTDAGVPHGLVLSTGTSGVPPRTLAEAEIFVGPERRTLSLAPLVSGPYLFSCQVHPTMLVEVTVR